MNPDPECNCCPPATCGVCKPTTCEPCMPQCSSAPYIRIRAPRHLKYESVCSTKNCNIFGSHDTNPIPDLPCPKFRNKMVDENKNSLGSPIGVVASNVNFKAEGKPSDIVQARFATYLEAFARLHLNDEKSWDHLLVDDIMKEGLNLYAISRKNEASIESPSDIYMPNEDEIMREFELAGFTFQVELTPQFKLIDSLSSENGAKGDGVELTLEDFVPAIKSFFRNHKYALITVGTFYVMIWRSNDAYFVFDICGRRTTDFQSDKDKGVAMLMCFRTLENVRHLIVNRSDLQISDPLTIRELKVVKVITPVGGILQKEYRTRTHQYEVVNDDYAYLKSELHLTLNKQDLLRNRSGFPVAVAAIVVSKIDHPATWDIKMVDKIICFGVTLCQTHWFKCKSTDAIDVNEFPTFFTLGQFHIIIEFIAQKYAGVWRCVPGFKHSELAQVLQKAFDEEHYKLILQINYQIYAIWKKNDFIYLFDPYRHRILGKPNESEIYEEMEKSATVRMFRSFEVFMNVFNNILLDSNRTSPFFIHILKVKSIQPQTAQPSSGRQIKEPELDANGEVLSINEHICFEEAEDLCKLALGEISDYEDDDLKSDVYEMELRTSSSEAEVLEEEEAGPGDMEEMEGLESSSSGEEGGGHKKHVGGGKTGGKGGKGKGKGGKKGGTSKGKKGKGTNDSEGDDNSKKRKKGKNIEDEDEVEDGNTNKKSKPNEEEGDGKMKTDSKDKIKDEKKPKNKGKGKKGGKVSGKKKHGDYTTDEEDSNNDKEPSKDKNKDRSRDKDQNKDKDLSKDKERDLSRDRDLSKDRDLSRDRDISKDKEQSKDKGLSKEKDKDLSKDKGKDLGRDRDISKDKEQSRDKGLSKEKDKDLSKDKGKDLGRDRDISKEKEQSRDKGVSKEKDKDLSKDKGKDLGRDRDLSSDRDLNKDKDINKGKGLSKDKDLSKDKGKDLGRDRYRDLSRDRDLNRDRDLSKDKDLNKGKGLNKDKDLSKDKDRDLNADRGLNKDKDLNKDKAKDLGKDKDVSKDKDQINNKDARKDQDQNKVRDKDMDPNKDQDLSKDGSQDKDLSKYTDKYELSYSRSFKKRRGRLGSYDDDDDDDLFDPVQIIPDKGPEKEAETSKEAEIIETKEKGSDKENELSKNVNEIIDMITEVEKPKLDVKKPKPEKVSDKSQRSHVQKDGTDADDEADECLTKKPRPCSTPNPNRYPGYFKCPVDMAVIGSESGSYESICKLFQAGFKVADRLLMMTPWGNFVIFRCSGKSDCEERHYYLFDGCTCNFDRFRHLDLSVGTAGLLCFHHTHNVIEYIRHLRKTRKNYRDEHDYSADDVSREYNNNKNFTLCL